MFLEQIPILRDLTLPSILLRVFLAMFLSGILGIERGRRRRPAGFRTYMIVCIGSTLAMMVGLYVAQLTQSGDATRISAQVISGIGFLGAGTILVTKQNHVKGLTTAAGLWANACLGLALGAGFYSGAIISFAALLISVHFLHSVDKRLRTHSITIPLYVEFAQFGNLSNFLSYAQDNGCGVANLEISQDKSDSNASLSATISLTFKEDITHAQIIETYGALEGVVFLSII